MDITLTLKDGEEMTPEIQAYLDKCEAELNHKWANVSREDMIQHVMVWGTCVYKEDENGQFYIVQPEDLYKNEDD